MNDVSSMLFRLTRDLAGDLAGKHGWPMCLAWNIILPALWEIGARGMRP